MFANGLSTVISGFFGSTPNTTYGENIGVIEITRVYSTWVIGGAAIFDILLYCVGKLAAAIQMIPLPVMGGVSLLLYGVIGASGIRFAILTILPAALVVIAEHVGHLVVTANIVKKDLLRDPGLHRSMFANGLSTVISGFFGSTPNTTYGENIGVMAITRVYSTWVIGGAAIFAILLSCVGKLAAAIQMIPLPVMGGVSLLLYGVIGASGIRVLIESKVDYNKAQNLILTSVILIIGVSGAKVNIGAAELKGMALATIVGIGLSLIFKLISVLRPEEVVLDAEDADITDK